MGDKNKIPRGPKPKTIKIGVDGIPKPDAATGASGSLFQRLADELRNGGRGKPIDSEILIILSDLIIERKKLKLMISRGDGYVIESKNKQGETYRQVQPEVAELRRIEGMILKYAKAFGITPEARAGLPVENFAQQKVSEEDAFFKKQG
jgi:phage terminase small subunit